MNDSNKALTPFVGTFNLAQIVDQSKPQESGRDQLVRQIDYIIVGAGSSGCVATSNLVRAGQNVLLLEAGGADRNPLIRMPAGFLKFLNGHRLIRDYYAQPEPDLAGRSLRIGQGRALGGSSSVNAMVYMRGVASDYDAWAVHTGDERWGWGAMHDAFVAQESNARLSGPDHGTDGPLWVGDLGHTCALSERYVQTAEAAGLTRRDDFNAGTQLGTGYMQYTMRNRRRWSAKDAFLGPVLRDHRLTLQLNSPVDRLIIEEERVCGVVLDNGARFQSQKGVILCAGAFETPRLLLRSGIGPGEDLSACGIDVKVDAPGVGQGLMDHCEVPTVSLTTENLGYHGQDRGWRMVLNGIRYLLARTGPVASTGVETCSFVSTGGGPEADVKLYCVPSIYLDPDVVTLPDAPGLTLNACLLKPFSRGSLRLSRDGIEAPLEIRTGFLSDQRDIETLIGGVRFARELMQLEPLKSILLDECFPGLGVQSDEALTEHCRRSVKTNWHPCGTVRMGSVHDEMSPLMPDLSVKGTRGLWVLDASAIPEIPRANTNAVVMALAHVGSKGLVNNAKS